MKIKRLYPNIYVATCKTQRELAHMFMRFQEHYESPNVEFRQRPFTREAYKQWYRKEFGRFSYYSDWSGFNLPGKSLMDFYAGQFKNLTSNERKILKYFRNLDVEGLYIIGVSTDNGCDALEHEISHALFDKYESYRGKVCKCLDEYVSAPLRKKIEKWLLNSNYASHVLVDETQAFVMFDRDMLAQDGINVPELVSQKLYAIFQETLRLR